MVSAPAPHDRRARAAVARGGAFLLWGPVGVGNGPFAMRVAGTNGSVPAGRPLAVPIVLANSGGSPAVVDSVRFVSVASDYPSPHVFAIRVSALTQCIGAWPLPPGRTLADVSPCGLTDRGPVIGYRVGPGVNNSAIAEVRALRPGSCFVLTGFVVRYHVGFRYYTATDPASLAFCATRSQAVIRAAAQAAGQPAS